MKYHYGRFIFFVYSCTQTLTKLKQPKPKVKEEVKIKPKKSRKSRPRKEVDDKELLKRPDYDIGTLERRFWQLKINKLANRIYNGEIAKNHRILWSEFNKKFLDSKFLALNFRYQGTTRW